MTTFTFKQSFTALSSMQPAYDLFERCIAFDKFMPKIYWHTLNERRQDNRAFDYLCFSGDRLVGMLNVLFFSETAEFTVLIDPEFRGQKICKKLLQIAVTKLKNYVVSHYLLISPFECKREGAVWDHDEVEMRAPDIHLVQEIVQEKNIHSTLTLSRAMIEENDLHLLADIHTESFEKPTYQAMRERFSVTLKEPNRKAFIARNSDHEPVGKLHAREDFNRILVHDVGIKKSFRQQGYGKSLMLTWLKEFGHSYGGKPIAVEVLGNNAAALKLYESCGFELTNTYHFFKFTL